MEIFHGDRSPSLTLIPEGGLYKLVRRSDTPGIFGGMDPRVQSVALIAESGLYKLVRRSDKPQAKPFQDWIAREVLPTTKEYLAALAEANSLTVRDLTEALKAIPGMSGITPVQAIPGMSGIDLVQAIRGGKTPGTWAHPNFPLSPFVRQGRGG